MGWPTLTRPSPTRTSPTRTSFTHGPTAAPRSADLPEPLLLEWLALAGLLAFATWLLGVRGVWGLLLSADPTGITLVIIVVFFTATLWCGSRSRVLQRERAALACYQDPQAGQAGRPPWGGEQSGEATCARAGWAGEYLAALRAAPRDAGAPLDLLLERTHGPHGTAWWVNGIQLKLGLLGKVIGFSILALQIGQMQNFDPSQSQDLLKNLTTGLGVALLTTMVGLVGNIVLGLQLTRLDRYADALVADIQRAGIPPEAPAAPPPRGGGPRGPAEPDPPHPPDLHANATPGA